jgi:hypothetical protein
MNESRTLPVTESGLFTAGNWTLYGPTRSETVPYHKADLAIFRLTGEWPESIAPVEQGFIVRTPTKWVHASLVNPL